LDNCNRYKRQKERGWNLESLDRRKRDRDSPSLGGAK